MVIGARKTIVREIDENLCDEFLNKHHLQKTCKGQKWRYGLFYNDTLIAVMTFGYPRYDKYAQYELLRLCFDGDYKVIGGSEKLFKYFIDTTQPKNQHNSIVSYCDDERFKGDVYKRLGFRCYYKPTKKQIVKYVKNGRYITAQELRLHGADQLIGTKFGKGTDNDTIMLNEGWEPIYELGSSRWYYSNFGTKYVIYKMQYGKYTYIGQHIGDNIDKYNGSGSKWLNVVQNDFTNIDKKILKIVNSNIDANIEEIKAIKKDKKDNPLYNCNIVERSKQVIVDNECPECHTKSNRHKKTCSRCYKCSECGAANNGRHKVGCSKYKERAVCSECGQLNHKSTCSKAKICTVCGGNGNHLASCPLSPKCTECGGANGRHKKICSKYVDRTCSECHAAIGHKKTCSKYIAPPLCDICGSPLSHHKIWCSNRIPNISHTYCEECHKKLPSHKKTCSKYERVTIYCSECGAGNHNHKKTCSKYNRKACSECGSTTNHHKGCSHYRY